MKEAAHFLYLNGLPIMNKLQQMSLIPSYYSLEQNKIVCSAHLANCEKYSY